MYTERYMGLPTYEDNLIGYENGSLLDKVDKIKGKRFQVNHGVADDNVSNSCSHVVRDFDSEAKTRYNF